MPKQKFPADTTYKMQASGDTHIPRDAAEPPEAVATGMLPSVMCAIGDAPKMKHTVEKRPAGISPKAQSAPETPRSKTGKLQ